MEIQEYIKENGIEKAIEKYTEITKKQRPGLFEKILDQYKKID